MHRQPILSELSAYAPFDEGEAASLREMIGFIEVHENCFDRALTIGHMTAAAWLLDRSGRHALLTHHRKLDRWLQLGGHADGCADLRSVALREAREESGIDEIEFVTGSIFDVDVHDIPARRDEPAHRHYDVRFLMRVCSDKSFRVSDESHALGWFSMDELESLTVDVSVRRMAAKWAAWSRSRAGNRIESRNSAKEGPPESDGPLLFLR